MRLFDSTRGLRIILIPFVVNMASALPALADDPSYSFTSFDVPGAASYGATYGSDVNSRGDVVGYYYDVNNNLLGFLRDKNGYTTIAASGAAYGTYALGINARGQIVGYY
jgi:hypothetical protein